MTKTLFIGITSWNSAKFLDCSLSAIKKTTMHLSPEIVVLDNCSIDDTIRIAKKHGVTLIQQNVSQAKALNCLVDMSKSEYTLLLHADTVLLSDQWFDCCVEEIDNHTILIAPEDIGCGPMTRDFGRGHPESSFLLFNTYELKKLRRWRVSKQRFKIPTKLELSFDFFGPHITHNINKHLEKNNKSWKPMSVLASDRCSAPIYHPDHISLHWTEELSCLEYGLGNFYAIGDTVTHYHNWYDRVDAHESLRSNLSTGADNEGFPVQFVHEYSSRFLNDYWNNAVKIPTIDCK